MRTHLVVSPAPILDDHLGFRPGANTYANYAMMAAMMGSSSMAMVFFSYKSQIEQEIAALESALAYWQAYVPTVALADGGVARHGLA